MDIALFSRIPPCLPMKSRRQQPTQRRKRRWRLVCEALEPRLMMAADTIPESRDLLDALDSLALTSLDDNASAEVASDDSLDSKPILASDPGSLAAYLANWQTSIDSAGDEAYVEPVVIPPPRHNNVN